VPDTHAIAALEPEMTPAEVPVVSSVRPRSHTEVGWIGQAIRRLGLVDPEIAGRVIVGLLLLQGDLIDDELTYDVAIVDGDCYSVTVTEEETVVNRIPVPRPLASIDGRVETTLDALGSMPITGRLRTVMRAGPVKVRGRRRKRVLSALRAVASAPVGFAEVRRTGIELEDDLLLAIVAAGIAPEWTIGHRFTIGFDTGDRPTPGGAQLFLRVNDGGPVALSCGLPLDIPTSAVSCGPRELTRLLLGHPVEGNATLAGERAPFMLLQGWVTRLESGRG
jgi:hypothetical protein